MTNSNKDYKMYKQAGYKGVIVVHHFTDEYGNEMPEKTKRFSSKKYPTQADVNKGALEWIAEVQGRIDNKMKMLNEMPTFGEFYKNQWRATHMTVETSTQTNARLDTTLRQKTIQRLYPLKLDKITTGYLQWYFESKRDVKIANRYGKAKKPTKSMVKNWKDAVASIFKEAIHQGYVKDNPTHGIDMKRCLSAESKLLAGAKSTKRNAFTPAQYNAILDMADKLSPQLADVIRVMLYCGLRSEEVVGLSVNDVNLKDNILTVRRAVANTSQRGTYVKETKTGKSRDMYFNAQAAEVLKRRIELAKNKPADPVTGETWLFSRDTDNKLIKPAIIANEFTAVRNACASVPAYSMYSLRHTFASIMLAHHYPAAAIADQMGHTLAVFLEYYAHAFDADKKGMQNFNF